MTSHGAPVTETLALEHGLSPEEYHHILKTLGRTPTFTELGLFSALWNEHCSYKTSKTYLRRLPTEGPSVLQGPGENAGAVDLGDGLAAVLKMESHNHPSFIEPYQGAATGVGGILRDIFTMGARPIALLNSLRFGNLSEPRTRYLMTQVVAGIAGYGNCIGIPTVGGEIAFDPDYAGNPLVNVFALGLVPKDRILRARAGGVGNPVAYVGARTGRDGIHGAAMASLAFGEGAEQKRPAVQVGDPFLEKLLLEACLEIRDIEGVVGLQDMGGGGLTSSSAEMAARGGAGIRIDVSRVPRREPGMSPYEVMLSESQERMLMVLRPEGVRAAEEVFAKWDLEFSIVGEVTGDGHLTVLDGEEEVARVPAALLADGPPLLKRPEAPPPKAQPVVDLQKIPEPENLQECFLALLSLPEIGSKHIVYEQYDHMVRTNTILRPGGDAAVLRLKGSRKGIAITVDGNSRYCSLDPFQGGAIAVVEAARNLSSTGATPLGLTDCLNFGNPEDPHVMWQFSRAIDGVTAACQRLEVPVVSGNVSFYNETLGKSIPPTPAIGMVGVLEDAGRFCPTAFQRGGDLVVLLGGLGEGIGGSLYLWDVLGSRLGPCPKMDLEAEVALHGLIRTAIREGLLSSCHDVSDGGLAVALAEAGLLTDPPLGASISLSIQGRADVALFGEDQGRALVSLPEDRLPRLLALSEEAAVPVLPIGKVGGERLLIELEGESGSRHAVDIQMTALMARWWGGLQTALKEG